MAFWGVEVKPGKPYAHVHDSTRGRLRISQATLGIGTAANKSTVQCNVGTRSPILLCHLTPNASETCHMELEFEEAAEVIFSILGKRSVHLSGYYIGSSGRVRDLDGDESESYGEDIAETDTSRSNKDSEDDKYESDFIDDDEIEMLQCPSRHKSGVVIDEITEDDKPSNRHGSRRRLKKKHQLSDSDDDGDGPQGQLVVKRNNSIIFESEDDDAIPISFLKKKTAVEDSEGKLNSKSNDENVDLGIKPKIDTISHNGQSTRESLHTSDDMLPLDISQEKNLKSKKKKKPTAEKPLETNSITSPEEKASAKPDKVKDHKEANINKDKETQNGEANFESKPAETDVPSDIGQENNLKSKKKKKKAKDGKPLETYSKTSSEERARVKLDSDRDDKEVNVCKDHGTQTGVANVESKAAGIDGADNEGKPRKKHKKTKKGEISEAGDYVSVERAQDKSVEVTFDVANNDKMDQDLLVSDRLEKLPYCSQADNSSVPSAPAQETSGKLKKKDKKKRAKDDRGPDAEGAEVADVDCGPAKKKKKEIKANDQDLGSTQESGEHGISEVTKAGSKTRSYSDGTVRGLAYG